MIDEIYNSRIGAIKTCHSSVEWEQTAIEFEKSLTEKQTIIFHKLCDLQSETATDESCIQGRFQGWSGVDGRGSGVRLFLCYRIFDKISVSVLCAETLRLCINKKNN